MKAEERQSGGPSVTKNVFDVLRCFSSERPLVGVTEIASQVGLHKSSVSRLLAALEAERIVEQDPETRKFRLGLGLIAIAAPLLADLDVRKAALPFLQELVRRTHETAGLMVWDEGESVSVEQVPSTYRVKHTSEIGVRYRAGVNSTVQIFWAFSGLSDAELSERIGSGRVPLPEGVSVDQYLERLAHCRDRGYAVNYGESAPDEVGIAAPVYDVRGGVAAAVMIAAPLYRVPESLLDVIGERCREAGRQISVRLGG